MKTLCNIPCFGLIAFTLICSLLWSCQDDEPLPSPSIVGLWHIDLTTTTFYDSLGNVTHTDTTTWVNDVGVETDVFERFTADNKYYFLTSPDFDTSVSSTYTLSGTNLTIHTPDSVFPLNDRTTEMINATSFKTYQMVDYDLVKYKMMMRHILVP